MIILAKTHLSNIKQHAITCYPYECCGAMLGSIDNDKKVVSEIVEIKNESDEDQRRRFKITAADYQKLEQLAHDKKCDLLGFYHSHPDHPAIPSKTDEAYGWPFFSYIILYIEKKEPQECLSYIFDFDQQAFNAEDILIKEE